MTPIEWTKYARADLQAIRAYIAKDSKVYARRFASRIVEATKRLRLFPECGAIVEEWEREVLREIYVGKYRVIYRFKNNRVRILAVIHGARQLPDLSDRI